MLKKLIVYGAGNPNIIKLINAINSIQLQWEVAGFLVDPSFDHETEFMGYPVLGGSELLPSLVSPDTMFINNIYSSTYNRYRTTQILLKNHCQFATLIHPMVDTTFTTISQGTIISEGVILGANAIIGQHCAIDANAVINHDNLIGNYAHISAGVTLSGRVKVGNQAHIGVGAKVRDNITIGSNTIVSAGAMVVRDVSPNTKVEGIPARELAENLFEVQSLVAETT